MVTKREAAVIGAYTGYLLGEIEDLHTYVEEVAGCPVFTHELPGMCDQLKDKIKQHFVAIEVEK